MAGFPFMRQAEAFLSSLPFILLLAVFILPCPMSAAAKPRPAIAFVHLLLPPGGEPHASPTPSTLTPVPISSSSASFTS